MHITNSSLPHPLLPVSSAFGTQDVAAGNGRLGADMVYLRKRGSKRSDERKDGGKVSRSVSRIRYGAGSRVYTHPVLFRAHLFTPSSRGPIGRAREGLSAFQLHCVGLSVMKRRWRVRVLMTVWTAEPQPWELLDKVT